MAKAKKMMQESIKLIDVVVEILDARIPLSSKNPDIDELAKGKYRVLLLNKSDMADEKKTAIWKKYLQAYSTSQKVQVLESSSSFLCCKR